MMEGSVMTLTEVIKAVNEQVEKEMRLNILAHINKLDMEVPFGDAVVQVEIHEVACPFEITDVQVYVLHSDDRKHSPLLEQTIINTLPDWFAIKHEYDCEEWYEQIA